MPQFAVILPAAGKSTRFGESSGKHSAIDPSRKKVFTELKGRPVWLRAVDHFVEREDVVQTIVVLSPEDIDWFKEKFRPYLSLLNVELCEGGTERADSVMAALARVKPEAEFVAIHDAARPLISKIWIDDVFAAAAQSGAAILAQKVTSTVKKANHRGVIETTVPREPLWLAQTPQVFRTKELRDAFAQRGTAQPTDEAQLMEEAGHQVSIVECPAFNLKITTPDDMRMAQALIDHLPKERSIEALLKPKVANLADL